MHSEWQPIETAPRDGGDFLASNFEVYGGFAQVVFWSDDRRMFTVKDGDFGYGAKFFTHWMPLPNPPKPEHSRSRSLRKTRTAPGFPLVFPKRFDSLSAP